MLRKRRRAMLLAAEVKDLMAVGMAADKLDQSLGELWNLHAERDIDWCKDDSQSHARHDADFFSGEAIRNANSRSVQENRRDGQADYLESGDENHRRSERENPACLIDDAGVRSVRCHFRVSRCSDERRIS